MSSVFRTAEILPEVVDAVGGGAAVGIGCASDGGTNFATAAAASAPTPRKAAPAAK